MALSPVVSVPRARDLLTGRPPVHAQSVDEANSVIADLFCAHDLTPLDRGVRMTLRSAHSSTVGLDLLDYSGGVRIAPQGLGSFHLVQIPLRGRARMLARGGEVQSSPRRATVPPLDSDFTMEWDEATPHLIVYLDRAEVERVAGELWNLDDAGSLDLSSIVALDTPEGQAFLSSVLAMHDLLVDGATGTGTLPFRLVSELMIARFLLAVDNSVARSLGTWSPPREPGHADALRRRFVALAEAAPTEDLSVLSCARALGVSVRTLQDHVRSASGRTPTDILRDIRFRRAHDMLLRADAGRTTVTAIAEQCGFGHLGRFAADYRARYGEPPATTLHR
ncbi:AraC family transcriptional regulator [Herbiconiux sp.]|uniref:AraC family transcriptional regulator n=1 Tax=Herbiconiux sp. TaxID=1871186 RepID=UPI0025C58F3A|nr:AraC family transcriptional regulator [Herbiconiux sp.]